MFYCVAYDISGHRLRRRVAKWCRQCGLRRLQKSIFSGLAPLSKIRELEHKVQAEIQPNDRFIIIPLDKDTRQRLLLLGNIPTEALFPSKDKIRYF
jgi:CRISPR-associated protein Cas2